MIFNNSTKSIHNRAMIQSSPNVANRKQRWSAFEHISKFLLSLSMMKKKKSHFFLPISTDFFLCVYAIFFIFAVVFFMSPLHGTLLVAVGDGYVAEQVFQQRTKKRIFWDGKTIIDGIFICKMRTFEGWSFMEVIRRLLGKPRNIIVRSFFRACAKSTSKIWKSFL